MVAPHMGPSTLLPTVFHLQFPQMEGKVHIRCFEQASHVDDPRDIPSAVGKMTGDIINTCSNAIALLLVAH